VFAKRYQTEDIAPRQRPVKSCTVEGALRAVGQTFAGLGAQDPWLTPTGKTKFRLSRQLQGYAKADDPPTLVKPIPVQVIHHAANLGQQHGTAESEAVMNMICTAFFFLCRPGEYTAPAGDNNPFRLCDVTFYIGICKILAPNISTNDLVPEPPLFF
jgi:hypothetical protein